jgi:peptide/nickel transport system substrate-binding protein
MKKLLLTTALLGLASAVAAQEITVGAANVSSYLDPGRDHSNVGSQFYYNAFDTLIGRDVTTTELVWEPALATEWELIDPLTMELKLREGVVFHNGEAMTAS